MITLVAQPLQAYYHLSDMPEHDKVCSRSRQLLNDARAGDVDAMRSLGKMLIDGNIVKRDVKNGILWLKKAVEAGDPRSMVLLGDLYRHGRGVSVNTEKAVELYMDAAELGNKNAEKRLVKMPFKLTVSWWEKQAEEGDKDAVLKLMVAYATGDGVSSNMRKAREFYEIAHNKWPKDVEKVLAHVPTEVNNKLRPGTPSADSTADTKTDILPEQPVPEKSPLEQLCEATHNADIVKVRSLLRAGVSPNAMTEDNNSPMLIASVLKEGAPLVRAMIEAGADVNQANVMGVTPLHFACLNPDIDTDIPQLLVNAGARVNTKTVKGETPLMMAACTGKEKAVRVLLEKKADVNDVCYGQGIAYIGCTQVDSSFTIPYDALKVACCKNFGNLVSLLIEAGADANAEYAGTPILFNYLKDPTMVRLFLKHEYRLENTNKQGMTALLATVGLEIWESAELLIKAGADVNVAEPEYGFTPLMLAAFHNMTDLQKLILKRGCDINAVAPQSKNVTALHLAAFQGHLKSVEILLNAGANAYMQTDDGLLAVDLARDRGHDGVAAFIAQYLQNKENEKSYGDSERSGSSSNNNGGQRQGAKRYVAIGGALLLMLIIWKIIAGIRKKRKCAETSTTSSEAMAPLIPDGHKKTTDDMTKPRHATAFVPQPALYHVKSSTGEVLGEYQAEELKYLISIGAVPPDVLVWTDGMLDWVPFSQVVHE